MAYNNKPFVSNPYYNKSFSNKSLFNKAFQDSLYNTTFNTDTFNVENFNKKPLLDKPYLLDTIYQTSYESTKYLKDARLGLPNKKYSQYLKNYNKYNNNTSLLSDYHDPYQINSVADVILKHMFNRGNLNGLSGIPGVGLLYDIADTVNTTLIKPLVAGQPYVAGLNFLQGASEDLDLIANPVKAVMITASQGGNVGQALLNSIGAGGQGHVNYNYDTGNVAGDILLELISDPTNFLFLGKGLMAGLHKAGVYNGTKAGVIGLKSVLKTNEKAFTEAATKAIGKNLSEEQTKQFNTLFQSSLKRFSDDDKALDNFIYKLRSTAASETNRVNVATFKRVSEQEIKTDLKNKLAVAIMKNSGALDQSTKSTFTKIIQTSLNDSSLKVVDDLIQGQISAINSGVTGSLFGSLRTLDTMGDFLVRYTAFAPVVATSKVFSLAKRNIVDPLRLANAHALESKEIFNNNIKNTNIEELINSETNSTDFFTIFNDKLIKPDLKLQYYQISLNEMFTKIQEIMDMPAGNNKPIDFYQKQEQAILDYLKRMSGDSNITPQTYLNKMTVLNRQLKKQLKLSRKSETGLEPYLGVLKDIVDYTNTLKVHISHQLRLDALYKQGLINSDGTANINATGVIDNPQYLKFIKDLKDLKKYIDVKTAGKLQAQITVIKEYNHLTDLLNILKKEPNMLTIRNITNELYYSPVLKKDKAFKKRLDNLTMNKDSLKSFLKDYIDYYYKTKIDEDTDVLLDVLKGYKDAKNTTELYDHFIKTFDELPAPENINLEKFIKLMDKKTKAITRVRYIKQIDPDTNKAVIVVRDLETFLKDVKTTQENLEGPWRTYVELAKVTAKSQQEFKEKLLQISKNRFKETKPKEDIMDIYKEDLKAFKEQLGSVESDKNMIKNIQQLTDRLIAESNTLYRYYPEYAKYTQEDGPLANLATNVDAYIKTIVETPTTKQIDRSTITLLEELRAEIIKGLRQYESLTLLKIWKKSKDTTNKIYFGKSSPESLAEDAISALTKVFLEGNETHLKELSQNLYSFADEESVYFLKVGNLQAYRRILSSGVLDVYDDQIIAPLINASIGVAEDANIYEAFKSLFITELTKYPTEELDSVLNEMLTDFQILYKKKLGVIDYQNLIDVIERSTDLSTQTKNILLDNLFTMARYQITDSTEAYKISNDLVDSINKFKRYSSAETKKHNLNAIAKEVFDIPYKLDTEEFDNAIGNIIDSLCKEYNIAGGGRHTAIGDAVLTAHVYIQKECDGDILQARGKWFLDTETTNLLDKHNQANGELLEIGVVEVTETGKLISKFNNRVRTTNTEDIPIPDYLKENLAGSIEAFDKRYSTKDKAQIYTETNLLNDFSKLIYDIKDTPTIVTFNGKDFDIPYLIRRSNIVNPNTKLELNKIPTIDYYQELLSKAADSKALLTQDEERVVKNIINNYVEQRKSTMQTFDGILLDNKAYEFKFIEELGDIYHFRALDNLSRVGQDTLTSYDRAMNKIYNSMYSKDLTNLTDDEVLNIVSTQSFDNEYIQLGVNEKFRQKADDLRSTLSGIAIENSAFKQLPIRQSLIENNENLEDLKNLIIKIMENERDASTKRKIYTKEDIQKIRDMSYSNFSQLMYAISKSQENVYAYYNVKIKDVEALSTIDPKTNIYPAAVLKYYKNTVKNLQEIFKEPILMNVIKPYSNTIKEALDMLKNYDYKNIESIVKDIEDELLNTKIYDNTIENQIKYELQELIFGMKYLKITDSNYYENFVVLEYWLQRLNKIAYNKTFLESHPHQPEIINLLKVMENKFPEVYDLAINAKDKVHIKVSLENDKPVYLKRELDMLDVPELYHHKVYVTDRKIQIDALTNTIDEVKSTFDEGLVTEYNDDIVNIAKSSVDNMQTILKDLQKLDPKIQYEVTKNLNKYADLMSINETMQVLALKPEEIRDYLINMTGDAHWLCLGSPRVKSNEFGIDLFKSYSAFLEKVNIKALEDLHINVLQKEDSNIYIGLDKEYYTNKITLNKNSSGSQYVLEGNDIPDIILKELDYNSVVKYLKINDKVSLDYLKRIYDQKQLLNNLEPTLAGRTGYVSSEASYDKYINNLDKNLISFTKKTFKNPEEYRQTLPIWNTYNLGNARDRLLQVEGLTTDYLYSITIATQRLANHLHKQEEYTMFLMNGCAPIDEVFEGIPDKELLEMLNTNDEIALVYMKKDKAYKKGYYMDRITTYNAATLKEARRLNARVVSYSDYEMFAEKINNFDYDRNGMLRLWHNVISSYKAGFLVSIGTVMRNLIDSSIKTLSAHGDLDEKAYNLVNGFNLISKFEHDMDNIKKMSLGYNKFTRENMENYFGHPEYYKPKLTKEEYQMIYDFMMVNGANSITSSDQTLFGKIMKSGMGKIEDSARLAQYLTLQDQGWAYDKIIKNISVTHFNYGIKSKAAIMAELFIPFYSFNVKNLIYFVDELLTRPKFIYNMFNFYTPIWNFDDQNYYELSHNSSLQYQMIAGNIPLKDLIPGVNSDITLKIGLSMLDTMFTLVAPVTSIMSKLAPPVSLVLNSINEYTSDQATDILEGIGLKSYQANEADYRGNFKGTSVQSIITNPEEILSLVPMISKQIPISGSMIQRYGQFGPTYYERSGNPLNLALPSVFGATKRYASYTPKKYVSKNYKYNSSNYSYNSYYKNTGYRQSYVYHRPSGSGAIYNMPFSSFTTFVHKASHPNYAQSNYRTYSPSFNKLRYKIFGGYLNKDRSNMSKALSRAKFNMKYS